MLSNFKSLRGASWIGGRRPTRLAVRLPWRDVRYVSEWVGMRVVRERKPSHLKPERIRDDKT